MNGSQIEYLAKKFFGHMQLPHAIGCVVAVLKSKGIAILGALSVLAASSFTATGQTTNGSGTIAGNNGISGFLGDLYAFIGPNSSNGIFNASEFDVDVLGTISHPAGKSYTFGADVALSYFFTTGLGSRFDVQYSQGQVTYTSISGIARTTFGTTNDFMMVSPYFVGGASHGYGAGNSFAAFAGIGIEYPFSFAAFNKQIHGRAMAEADGLSTGSPLYKIGLSFDWQR